MDDGGGHYGEGEAATLSQIRRRLVRRHAPPDAENDEEDDASSFELDLSQCPETGGVTDQFARMRIQDDDEEEERGDEMQNAAIAHAVGGGNLFLTGKAG